jgi:hypothetical protein
MSGKLDRLLHEFAWGRMDRVFTEQLAPRISAREPTAIPLPA